MKEGCSVAFLVLEGFTFCFSLLNLLPWKSETSARLPLPLKGKHIWVHSTGELAESLARSKRGGKKKKKDKYPKHYLRHFIKSKVFPFHFVRPPNPRVKIRCQALAISKSATAAGIPAPALRQGELPLGKACRRNRELAAPVLTPNVPYFYCSQ